MTGYDFFTLIFSACLPDIVNFVHYLKMSHISGVFFIECQLV